MYIDKREVLRYLSYRGKAPDDASSHIIDECIITCAEAAKPMHVYNFYDIMPSEQGILAEGTNIVLRGKNIARHLEGCRRCIIMAATIGMEIDNAIRIVQSRDMARAVILDACATACIEELCDIICREISENLRGENSSITRRFSPGYGDLPLDTQKNILSALNAQRRIGLTLTPTNIMIPRKSVTAIIGIKPQRCEKQDDVTECENCNNKNCRYSR